MNTETTETVRSHDDAIEQAFAAGLLPVRPTVPQTVATVQAAWPALRALKERVTAQLGEEAGKSFASLDTLADALAEMHDARVFSPPPVSRDLEALRPLVARLLGEAEVAVEGIVLRKTARRREVPRRRTGADEGGPRRLLDLVAFLEQHWDSSISNMTKRDLAVAEDAACDLITVIARKAKPSLGDLERAHGALVRMYLDARASLGRIGVSEADINQLAPMIGATPPAAATPQ